jgi:hypothetical protein
MKLDTLQTKGQSKTINRIIDHLIIHPCQSKFLRNILSMSDRTIASRPMSGAHCASKSKLSNAESRFKGNSQQSQMRDDELL